MKRAHKLRKKYGKLTVREEVSVDGRRAASVQCTCGRVKTVLVDSLVAGRTTSCAQGACKQYARVKRDKNYRPRPPRACTPCLVQRAWNRYHHPKPHLRLSMVELAEKHDMRLQTLTSLFRSVRRCGGIDKYMKAVTYGR